MKINSRLKLILQEGEGLHVEFKEGVSKQLDREIVAFANTSGGSIFLGVNDANEIQGIKITNALKSQIRDIAHNCDPGIKLDLIIYREEKVIEVKVEEGLDKPYRCRDGFYIREGDNTQKLKRDEIINFISDAGAIRFDEAINKRFKFPDGFSEESLDTYLKQASINKLVDTKDILVSLNAAEEKDDQLRLTNAGILFFAKSPQDYFPESYITAVKYKTFDRFSIIDKKEIKGTLTQQIDEAINFVIKHVDMEIKISDQPGPNIGRRIEIYDYPLPAIRESIINAVTHRDYLYDSSHIYIHMYPDRIEIENPGGLFRGMTLEMLSHRSVRRNRLIADLLHCAGYIEKVGSGFVRIQKALEDNDNPPYEISATNFFNIKFLKRIKEPTLSELTVRQSELISAIKERGSITTKVAALVLDVSDDTALNELHALIKLDLISRQGKGKATIYKIK